MCDDAAAAVRATLGMLNWTITWYSPDGPLSPMQIADQYADLLLEGLKVRGQPDVMPGFLQSKNEDIPVCLLTGGSDVFV